MTELQLKIHRQIGYTPSSKDPYAGLSKQDALLRWLKQAEPDLRLTLTLPKAVRCGKGTFWIKGERLEFESAYEQYIRRVSKRAYGKKMYRRIGKVVPNGAVVEGDGEIKRYHIHAYISCAPKTDRLQMEEICREEWERSPWTMTDFQILPTHGRWIDYCSKDGIEAVIIGSLRF